MNKIDPSEQERILAIFADEANRRRIEALLEEGLASGSAPLDMNAIREEVRKRRAGREQST